MAIANVTLLDTFDTWRTVTNQLIVQQDQSNTFVYGTISNTAAAFGHANAAFNAANSKPNTAANIANAYSVTIGAASNTWANTVGVAGNNYMITITTSINSNTVNIAVGANAWTNTVATAGNNYTDSVGLAGNNYVSSNFLLKSGGTITSSLNVTSNLVVSGDTVLTGNTTFNSTVNFRANIFSQVLTDSATINWDVNNGSIAYVTLGGNRIVAAPTNLKSGSYILHVIQDGSGNRTLTWNSIFKWTAGVAPPLTTTASARDIFTFICDGTNLYGSFMPDVK